MTIVALSVRKLKDGVSADEFLENFGPPEGEMPQGFKGFYGIRNTADEREVITFGIFDMTLDEFSAMQGEDYDEMRAKTDPMVDSFGASGVYEVLVEQKA